MTVEEVKQETEILLKITGRIDTNTSTQLQAEVLKYRKCQISHWI